MNVSYGVHDMVNYIIFDSKAQNRSCELTECLVLLKIAVPESYREDRESLRYL